MATQEKILVPSSTGKSHVILTPLDWIVPDNFEIVQQPNGQHLLQDNMGRINVSHIFNQAKAMDPSIATRDPVHWLRNQSTKDLRSNYLDLIGFDPVVTIRGGDRGKGENQHTDMHVGNYANINVSANGNVQTYGTYMTDRMLLSYASWVNFHFKVFCDGLILQHGGGLLDSGLTKSTDELTKENARVNGRYFNYQEIIDRAPANSHQENQLPKDVHTYVALLRSGFNLNISTGQYLTWLWKEGLFVKDYLNAAGEAIATYKPKDTYAQNLFAVNLVTTDNAVQELVTVTNVGHLATIEYLKKEFPQLAE